MGARRLLSGSDLIPASCLIPYQRQARHARDRLFKELNELPRHLCRLEGQSGDVSPGPREISDEPVIFDFVHPAHYNWNASGGAARCPNTLRPGGNDHLYVAPDEFGSECWESVE